MHEIRGFSGFSSYAMRPSFGAAFDGWRDAASQTGQGPMLPGGFAFRPWHRHRHFGLGFAGGDFAFNETTAIAPINVGALFGPQVTADSGTFQVSGLPAGLSYDAAKGQISGTPSAGAASKGANGTNLYPVVVTYTGKDGVVVGSRELTVAVNPPAVTLSTDATKPTDLGAVSIGKALPALTLPARLFPISGFPDWLRYNPSTGALTGTPPAGTAAGAVNLTFTGWGAPGAQPVYYAKMSLA